MSCEIRLSGEQGSLTLEINGYERPEAEDPDDANWLMCKLTIKAGSFSGAFKSAFTTYDLVALHERLKIALKTLSGTFTFRNTEDDVKLDVQFDERGCAVLSGTAQPHQSLEGSLTFRFDTDQSYLSQTLRQLEGALRTFRVKHAGIGAPDGHS